MSRAAVDHSGRIGVRVSSETKAKLLRAAAIQNIDLSTFVINAALREAEAVMEASAVIRLSERDYARVLDLLENPPKPNAKLLAAMAALADNV